MSDNIDTVSYTHLDVYKRQGFQYVSNYIVSEEENNNITWHTPRLTEDEWNDIYGGQ